MKPQDEGVLAVCRQEASGQPQDLGKPALPEPDEVEALEDDDVARPGLEVLLHLLLGGARPTADQEGHGFDVASLAGRVRGRRGARLLGGLPRGREALLEEQADRRAGVGQAETGIEPRGLVEPVKGPPAPAEEIAGPRRRKPSAGAVARGPSCAAARAPPPHDMLVWRGHRIAAHQSPGSSARPSHAPATRLRSIWTVPPAIVNMRASRTIRSSGRSRE